MASRLGADAGRHEVGLERVGRGLHPEVVIAEQVEPVQRDRLRYVGADFEGATPLMQVVLAIEVEDGLGHQAQQPGLMPGPVLPVADAAGLLRLGPGLGGGQLLAWRSERAAASGLGRRG